MAFNRLMLTADGKTLYAKAQQGKPLQFTRFGVGDGNIGSGSLVNRTALISEKKSLLIDNVQIVNETQSAVIASLSNSDLAEGFYFREIGIFAKDPDTQLEKLYLYDNAGDDGEFIPASTSGVIVNERLKILMLLENVTSVSFVPSGNPIYLSVDDIVDGGLGMGVLWSATYINNKLAEKIPKSLATAASQFLVSSAAGAWVVKTIAEIKTLLGLGSAAYTNSTAYATAAQGTKADGAIPLTQKGAASGVAELDSNGKVPSGQLPSYVDDVLEYANLASFPATGENGKIYIALDNNRTYRWSGTVYVEISQSIALGETSATAYRGDRGKTAYDHSQTSGNPHNTTAAQVGASTRTSGTGTLAVASWVGSAAPYSYEFAIAGLLAADTPHVDRVTGTDAAAAALINTAWGLIAGYAVKPQTAAGKITFYASAKPTVAIPIMWEVVRT